MTGTLNALKSRKSEIEGRIDTTAKELITEQEVHDFLIAVSDYILENDPVQSMETVITDVLQKLVNPNIKAFRIRTIEKRNQLETHFSVIRNFRGVEVEEPITVGMGGGAVDVAFFLLRIIVLVNHPTKPSMELFADEPVKNLSADRQHEFMALLHRLVEEFGLKIIMTTHEEEYIDNATQVVELRLKGDETVAKIRGAKAT